jgi:hypothetical protein
MTAVKLIAASVLLLSAASTYKEHHDRSTSSYSPTDTARRRLESVGDNVPTYMTSLLEDLNARKKLMDETPANEVKYWFEYTGPLQVSRHFQSLRLSLN